MGEFSRDAVSHRVARPKLRRGRAVVSLGLYDLQFHELRPQIDLFGLLPLKAELAFEVTCAVCRNSFHPSLHVVGLQ
jgi:hypothetical protein